MNTPWTDAYWLPLLQLYLKSPEGIKPLYSKPLVELGMKLHIHPSILYSRMFLLRKRDTPLIISLFDRYYDNRNKLARDVRKLWKMAGFGNAEAFYDGVETVETFERNFKPIRLIGNRVPEDMRKITPAMLVIVLDLYFRLTPQTMVEETPEIMELAKLLKLKPKTITGIMDIYQICDPYLKREGIIVSPLLAECHRIWNIYGNDDPTKLASLAAQLKDSF